MPEFAEDRAHALRAQEGLERRAPPPEGHAGGLVAPALDRLAEFLLEPGERARIELVQHERRPRALEAGKAALGQRHGPAPEEHGEMPAGAGLGRIAQDAGGDRERRFRGGR